MGSTPRSASRSVGSAVVSLTKWDTTGSPEPLPSLDELYRSAPADFVATRSRLVRQLKDAGDAENARALAKRKKPTRAAHAVNRLAHEHAADLGDYLDLAADMRAAQIAAARDERARDTLRTRDRERRDRLSALIARVPDDRDEVERALTAALVDPEVAGAVRAGTLERIPDAPSGFDAFAADLGDLPVKPRETAADRRRQDELEQLEAAIEGAQEEADARAADVRRARASLTDAERHSAAANHELDRLRRQRDKLAGP